MHSFLPSSPVCEGRADPQAPVAQCRWSPLWNSSAIGSILINSPSISTFIGDLYRLGCSSAFPDALFPMNGLGPAPPLRPGPDISGIFMER